MGTIGELLSRDLSQQIEEIIKVYQTDEATVYTELTEYVATPRIAVQYRELLKAMVDAPSEPHEGVGVWISGFFGSGKSSFAKNLGYVLANPPVLGRSAADLFKAQVKDSKIANFIDWLNTHTPTEVIMFDVSVERAVKRATERLAEVMYTVLLRQLDYAEDFDVAELEIELEAEGQLDAFVTRCYEIHGIEWRTVRKGAQKISRASAVLHRLDPATYPAADSWSGSLHGKSADITVSKFVQRAFDLSARRRPGKALAFIVDEVGQYVARSTEKIEDLRALIEEFGRESKNRLKAKQAVAPVWVIVTSQEKLDEVVAALDSKRVELAKLQDRFKHRIDLAPADIREVATRRVLAKKDGAVAVLKRLYADSQGQLNAACRLERTARKSAVTAEEFVQFYPYLPHFIELSIDIMSGIRLQPGAPKHLGGSNHTIIKQAYEMLVSPRTRMADKPAGALVTLDKIFELVEGNLSSERQKDISDIRERFKGDASSGGQDQSMPLRVAKAVCLLEFVRDLPRTEANIAACLVDAVGVPAPLAAVAEALKQLENAQFVRNTEDGWKLQTAQEKNWETERRGHLEPKPKDRHEILRSALGDVFGDPKIRTYRYKDLRSFRVGITVDGSRAGDEGQITLSICTADDPALFSEKLDAARAESRLDAHKSDLYWVCALTPEIDNLIANLYASRQMVTKYDQLRAQNKISSDEASCLQNETTEVLRLQSRLRDKVTEAVQGGTGLFRGVGKDGSALGKSLPEILKKLLDLAMPDLYPKLEMGARSLKGTEPEEVLKAANLSGLSQVFYTGNQGLGLVIKEGTKWVPNPSADVAKEVLDYLNHEHAYGNKETRTGKAVETHFGGIGYGWDLDMLRLVLAVLFRAGSVDVTHGGRRYDSYQEPLSRVPFTNNPAFRSALFTPAKPIDLKTLTSAVESYELLTGQTVDVEKNAIAAGLKKLAQAELNQLLPLEAQAQAHQLPVEDLLADYHTNLNSILNGSAEDCVRILAGEGTSLKQARDRTQRIAQAITADGLLTIRSARAAAEIMWPVLSERGENGVLAAKTKTLREQLACHTFYEVMPEIKQGGTAIAAAYGTTYAKLHSQRTGVYGSAVDDVKGSPEWPLVSAEMQAPVLTALTTRACPTLDLPAGATNCRTCAATLKQIESDLAALPGLKAQAIARIRELTASSEAKIERVSVAEFLSDDVLDSEDAVEQAIDRLREHLLKLVAEGIRVMLE